jgi:dipeptidyl aminopeptidase/acylaminoacyl peptidase
MLDVNNGESKVLTNDSRASEPNWLGPSHEVLWLKGGENGNTSFIIADGKDAGKTYTAGTMSGPVANLKIRVLEGGKALVAFSGKANPDGSLYNPKDVGKPHSSGKIYDSLFVRHWDTYVEPQRNTIWTALLQKTPSNVTARDGRWSLLGVTNTLKQITSLECPVPPFGGTDHFDITNGWIAMVSKDPYLNHATHTKCVVCVLRIPISLSLEETVAQPVIIKPEKKDRWGAATSPVFSPDGNLLAYLLMDKDGYESDQNQIHIIRIREGSALNSQALDIQDSRGKWDRSPSSVMFSGDGTKLLAVAEDIGCVCLFEFDLTEWLSSGSTRVKPRQLTTPPGSISDVARASSHSQKLFISSSTLMDSSVYYIVDPSDSKLARTIVSSLTNDGATFGLSPSQVGALWWDGTEPDNPDPYGVMAFMVKPSFFKAGKKYPLAYLIHGGPQGAWNDQWSTRWNPAVFAEQGYIVVAPNPTGSTGYGQKFTDNIRDQWGGLPYEDLVKGFAYIESECSDFIDTSRAVALGASYGGYMMNWIQGHDLGRKFKALVCHDGVFSMTAQLASDEQYFPIHDLGGPIWKNQDGYDKWDPSRFTDNWSTPQLIIHNELDYRLTIAEGLAAFNVLQMRGVDSRFLSFPDENHWVLGHENSLVWHTVVIDWINRYVGLPSLGDKEGKEEVEACRKDAAARMPVEEMQTLYISGQGR